MNFLNVLSSIFLRHDCGGDAGARPGGRAQHGLALVFVMVMIGSWMLENTKWQLPERYGLGIVLLSIPLFYFDWQYQKAIGEPTERLGVTALAHLIVFLSAVKLLQVRKIATGFFFT